MPKDVKEKTDDLLSVSYDAQTVARSAAETLIDDAVDSIDGDVVDQLDHDALRDAALRDANQLVHALLRHYDASDIDDVFIALDEDGFFEEHGVSDEDFEELGYYLAMQALGHGIAWSDNHAGKLWAPAWDAAMWYIHDEVDSQLPEIEAYDEHEDEYEDEDEDEEY